MIQEEKKHLREKLRRVVKQQQASATDLEQLLYQIQTLPAWHKAHAVLLYAPLVHEPDLLALLETPSFWTRRFFFPRMQQNELQLYEWFPKARWIAGPHGIQEPDPKHWRTVSLPELNLALIPGLAFDEQGGRLGWGRGYFDRLLGKSECSALKVGIAWPWQIVPQIPREAHDVTMDFVVTPEKSFRC
jgi:5-formyltetrahydrofolate cyclo-ligase